MQFGPAMFDGSLTGEDEGFDRHLPLTIQMKSAAYFTPVHVARVAARMLAPRAGMRVLDVGAGPGKFCVVAALEVPDATFIGVEIRPHLVEVARRMAREAGAPNARFIAGEAFDIDWAEFDAFYLFNPFAERLYEAALALDRTLPSDPTKFGEGVAGTRERLARARVGTRVVTYHSFGAPAPLGYDLIESYPVGTDYLQLWIKTR